MNKNSLLLLFLLLLTIISACKKAPEQPVGPPSLTAEETAKKLSIALQDRDYSKIYAMMVPEFQSKVSLENFIIAMEDTLSKYNVYVYEKTVEIGSDANAIISMSAGGLFKVELPLRLRKYGNEWKVDAFAGNIVTSCRLNDGVCMTYDFDCVETRPGFKYATRSKVLDQFLCKKPLVCCQARRCEESRNCPRPAYKGCDYDKGVCEPRQ